MREIKELWRSFSREERMQVIRAVPVGLLVMAAFIILPALIF